MDMRNDERLDNAVSLAEKTEKASAHCFGRHTSVHQLISEAVHCFRHDCRTICDNRGVTELTIAVFGTKGQGKTWLVRQFISDESILEQLPSGDLTRHATDKVVWVGHTAPATCRDSEEMFLRCDDMADLGVPYVLVDTPGLTDSDSRAAKIAASALSLAPVKLLVVRRDRLRDNEYEKLARLADGAVLIPVVTAVRDRSAELTRDLESFSARLRQAAPRSRCCDPIAVDDFSVGESEGQSRQQAVSGVKQHVRELQQRDDWRHQTVLQRLEGRRQLFVRQVSSILAQEIPDLPNVTDSLDGAVRDVLRDAITSLIGRQEELRIGIRQRLRGRILENTMPLWFPYRSVLLLLVLTHGAWDRLILFFSGSSVSLFSVLVAAARNTRSARSFADTVREGFQQQIREKVRTDLQPRVTAAVSRLRKMLSDGIDETTSPVPIHEFEVVGIESLQQKSTEIFNDAVNRHATWRLWNELAGLLCTAVFLALLSGPVYAIYQEYLEAAFRALSLEGTVTIREFPTIHFGTAATSVVLSIIPVAVLTAFFLTFWVRRKKVERCEKDIQDGHDRCLQEFTDERKIRVHFRHSVMDSAKFLADLTRGITHISRGA